MNVHYQIADRLKNSIADWLESKWVTPAFAGWLLGGLAIFYFGAATNTMAGWLYVQSGVCMALLAVAAVLPVRSLRELRVSRRAIEPASVDDQITIEIEIENPTNRAKTLLQVQDILPYVLGNAKQQVIEEIPPQSVYKVIYYQPAKRRGIYRWDEVQLRTATPLGLFWCRRSREAKAIAIVYPKVVSLSHCPLVDEIGKEDTRQLYSDRRSLLGNEGITRTLRPYRHGDPIRLIHWRTSARYGEFRVRELEISTGGQDLIISLDSAGVWRADDFEQAVVAAASLYFYASRASRLNVKLWTAQTGLVQGHRVVLEALAATGAGEDAIAPEPPALPLIWLTQNPLTLDSLPPGSRWVLWPSAADPNGKTPIVKRDRKGIEIQPDKPLELQLQAPLR